ncbi:DUF6608 family protein [Natronospora cellulosivora (SeqCode)]
MRINLNLKKALILICIVYTVLTITSSTWALLAGRTTDTHFHLIMRFLLTSIGIGSILLFNFFPKWPPTAIFAFHYAVTMGLVFILVGFSGFFVNLHPNAYRDIFLNFTLIYLLISSVFIIRDKVKSKKINKV